MALTLEIVTPEQRVLSQACDEVRLTGLEGGFGVRPGHTPLVAALAAGPLTYVIAGREQHYAVGEGFAEVSDDRVRVLVEEAHRAEDLDAAKVQGELEQQSRDLAAMKPDDPGYALRRAQVQRTAARALVATKR